jgi:replicative DNA helicase
MDAEDYDSSVAHMIYAGANTEIIFAKYRGGSTGTTLLKWVGDKTKFIDVDDATDMNEDIEAVERVLPMINPGEAFDDVEPSDVPF